MLIFAVTFDIYFLFSQSGRLFLPSFLPSLSFYPSLASLSSSMTFSSTHINSFSLSLEHTQTARAGLMKHMLLLTPLPTYPPPHLLLYLLSIHLAVNKRNSPNSLPHSILRALSLFTHSALYQTKSLPRATCPVKWLSEEGEIRDWPRKP